MTAITHGDHYPTLEELADLIATQPDVGYVRIHEEKRITARVGYDQQIQRQVKITIVDADDNAVEDIARLTLNEDGRVYQADLHRHQPYWAVEAVRRALRLDP